MGGDEASKKMASEDLARMRTYKTIIGNVARKHNVDPALIAAIISRESRGGAAISGNNGWCSKRKSFGLMQVAAESHTPSGAWDSKEHLDQATGILVGIIEEVQGNFSSWSPEQHLKGALAYYNMGSMVLSSGPQGVDHHTKGGNYSADVLTRAEFYRQNEF
ncbi:unnamed protein product [Arctogadus glacialis]